MNEWNYHKISRENLNSKNKQVVSYLDNDVDSLLAKILGSEYVSYRKKWEKACNYELVTEFPLFLVLEMGFDCNLACVMCFHGYNDLERKYKYIEKMSWDDYCKIIDEALKYKCPSISLNNNNEPLLSKDLPKRIKYAHTKGFLDIWINTNGILLNESLIENIIDAGLTRLSVSVDAFYESTYNKLRKKGNFKKLLYNIEKFLEIREKKGSRLPLLRITFVKTSLNEYELNKFIEYWRDKADYISIQEFISPYLDKSFNFLFAKNRLISDDFRCQQPWQRLIIQGNGDVLPCCVHFANELKIGNIKEKSIHELWHSEEMNYLRNIHKNGKYFLNPICKKCVENAIKGKTT